MLQYIFLERGENMHRCTYMHTKAHMPRLGGDGDSIIRRRCGLCENMQNIFHIYCLLRLAYAEQHLYNQFYFYAYLG